MPRAYRILCCWVMGLSSGSYALSQIQVDNAVVGQRTLIITIDDSIQAPDLSKLRVEGYEIESAVFLEEMGDQPIRFSPTFVDLTLPENGRIVDYIPTPGTLIVDLPGATVPAPGHIFADTSFGGLLRKVIQVDGQPQSKGAGRRWVLKTVEAGFPEAVQDCDLAFKTRMDMNQALTDIRQSHELLGASPDGAPASGLLDVGLKGAQVLFQPVVTGRIKVKNGAVEMFRFNVSGDLETMADITADLHGVGEFEFEEELPGKAPALVLLGSGLFLKMQNRPFLRMEAVSRGERFIAQADFRIRNSIKGDLSFNQGQWRPMAENKMTWSNKPPRELSGDGSLKVSLKPRIEMLLEGVQGPVFTFEPFARFASAPGPSGTAGGVVTAGGVATPGGVVTAGGVATPGGVATSDAGASPAAAAKDSLAAPSLKDAILTGNKELSLGSDIFMEARTNFTGPTSIRNFLLFSREQSVLSPPREGTLFLREADSGRVFLQCQTYPRSDYYIVQQKLGTGPWETVAEKAVLPKIHMDALKPGSQYRFRAFGVNRMGIGPAFPAEGVVFITPALNRPPFLAPARFPDSGSMVPGSPLTLTWKGGDPDPGSRLSYTVHLDVMNPPQSIRAGGIQDTFLTLPDLKPGMSYYWKVTVTDGASKTESPIRNFTVQVPQSEPGVAKGDAAKGGTAASAYPMVLLPKGSYRREDGRVVQVDPFLIGRYEVTQAEFGKVAGSNPSYRLQDSLPVDRVTWEEAESFCRETGGRLPTEAEWEYAARAGMPSSFYWGSESPGEYAWYRDNSENRTQKIGLKKPNPWGLYDIAGNVFEWVEDWYGDYSQVNLDNPKGPASGTAKVIRGASWYSESGSLSLTARYNNRPGFRNFKVGFRCAKDSDHSVTADQASVLASQSAGTSATDTVPAK